MHQPGMGDGGPVTLFEGGTPFRIAVASDDASVYWTDASSGTVMKWSSGGQTTVLAKGQAGPSDIAVDAKNVYWTNASEGTVTSIPRCSYAP
jgi:DNA-binding beta-propeller fold protein YncE